jgi:CPA2 family monovalent cation:H+ antiporter-2
MYEVPILINITFALVVAFIGGTIARRIGLPTIVGYLLAGVVIGPFTPGFVGDVWRRSAFFVPRFMACT